MSPAEIAAHTDLIRTAIADPGQFCERNKTWDDGWEEWDYERIPSWSARAVVIALTRAEIREVGANV